MYSAIGGREQEVDVLNERGASTGDTVSRPAARPLCVSVCRTGSGTSCLSACWLVPTVVGVNVDRSLFGSW